MIAFRRCFKRLLPYQRVKEPHAAQEPWVTEHCPILKSEFLRLVISMNKYLRLLAVSTTLPCSIYFGNNLYCQWKFHKSEEKQYESDVFEEKDSDVMLRRQKIVEVMKELFEMKVIEQNIFDDMFDEQVTYEDPYTLCKGKNEVQRIFAILPTVVDECQTIQFDPKHHKHFIQIVHEYKLGYKSFFNTRAITRSGNLILKLKTVHGCEVVESITDEWNGKAIHASISGQQIWYLLPFQTMRYLRTRVHLFLLSFKDLSEKPVNSNLQDSLLAPDPKYSNK